MPSTNGHGPKGGAGAVALCLRVSSEEQRDRETIEIQRDFLAQYCELYGLEVADVYADDGVSGTIPLHERPEGKRLLEDAKEGKFQTLLVYRLDRLGRSLLVIVDAHDRLQTAGVSLRSATEPIDTSTPSGRLIFQMLASFAEYERETIGERTRAGLHRAFRNGKHAGRIPYGYRLAPDETSLEVVEEEARIVHEIIANMAEGSTLYGESKRLNEEGVPSPGFRFKKGARIHGAAWSPSTVATIVHQSAYSGVHRVKAGDEYIERQVPPIVDVALQERALAALGANKHRASPRRKNARKYLLTGLIRCGVCGFACTGRTTTTRSKKYSYYGCTSHRTERGVSTVPPHRPPNVSAPWLEELVWADVKRFITNPGETLERIREQLRGDTTRTAELEARREDLSSRLAAKHLERDRYIRLYAQGHLSETELETYLADLANQIGNLKLLIKDTETEVTESAAAADLADTTSAWLARLAKRAEEVEEDAPEAFLKRQRLVRLLVERITMGRGLAGETSVEITYRFGPPEGEDLLAAEGGLVVGDEQNSCGNLAANRKPSGTTSRHFSTVERRGVP